MALTLGTPDKKVPGAEFVSIVDITFDSSYPAGGEVLTAADLGLNTIVTVLPSVAVDPDTVDNALVVAFDHTNSKILLFWGNNDGGADGPLVEVADTTNVAAYTARLIVYGV